jgi:DNA-binding NtrC family response regulator
MGFDVVVIRGASAGLLFHIDGASGAIFLGTSPLCPVRISDPTVSRRHASLEATADGLVVTDLGSTNGTFVNEVRVAAAFVGVRDRIRLGSSVMEASPRPTDPETARPARSFGRIASASPRMLNVLALCEQLAARDISIVIEGETGTGKELLAECIHEASPRHDQPFVVLDCRTTPRNVVESLIFGEYGGDAQAVRPGAFELAHGGTLFIDEPGDLDHELQVRLLRALDKGVVQRIGDARSVTVDVRILAATAYNLEKLIDEGKFREDLYYRLAGARIELPPLRRRREDIPLLAGELWSELGGKGLLSEEFLERFQAYDWPGNVRELEGAIERLLALGDMESLAGAPSHRRPFRSPIEAAEDGAVRDAFKQILSADLGYSEARQRVLQEFERAYLEKALAKSGGNVAAAAAASGIARRYFQRIRARQR